MKKLLIMCFLALSFPVMADEIMLHGLTWHKYQQFTDTNGSLTDYNVTTYGVTYIRKDGFAAGVYQNSYYKFSFHIDYRYMFNDYIGAFIGYATGYENYRSNGVIGGIVLRTPAYEGWRINLMGIPTEVMTLAVSKEF